MGEGTSTTHIAGPSHIIKRPRLTKILDETEARIILLCAPAGYGKTTLAREWVATREEPVLWYSGGPAMADVAALAVDLAELFAGTDSRSADQARLLAARSDDARSLAKALTASMPGADAILVLDDCHHAVRSEASETVLRELIERSNCRLLITSRIRPAWIDARAEVYGAVERLGVDRLAFTEDEARAVLPHGDRVLEQARGWPAVIGLAAASARSADEPVGPIEPARLYDFVAQDVFAAASPRLQDALLVLGAGGDATRAGARELFGSALEEIVEEASVRGFFVRDTDGWFAIHPLVRDFLFRRLSEVRHEERDAVLARVLTVLRQGARWDELLRLLQSFPRADDLVHALVDALPTLLAAGRVATVEEWVAVASTHRIAHPIVDLARAETALRRGRNVDAIAMAMTAAKQLRGDLCARAYLVAARAGHQQDDIETAASSAAVAAQLAETPELQTEAVWLALVNIYERDKFDHQEDKLAHEHFERLRNIDDPRLEHELRVACAEAFLATADDGDLRRGLSAIRRAESISDHVRDPLLRTNVLNYHAHILRLMGEYEFALRKVDELVAVAEDSGLDFVADHALLSRAGAFVGLRAVARAKEAIRELEQGEGMNIDYIRRNTVMHAAKLKVAVGDVPGAALLLDRSMPNGGTATAEYSALRSLLAAALEESAAPKESKEGAKTSTHLEVVAYVQMAAAIRAARDGDAIGAAHRIRDLLKKGMADAVTTACRAYPGLAQRAVEGGAGFELERVLSRSHDADLGRRAGLEMPRELRRGELLSPRELEVYELLVEGLTNPEIARALFISESTAKVHVRHIYDKLGVHSRAEAATLASEIRAND